MTDDTTTGNERGSSDAASRLAALLAEIENSYTAEVPAVVVEEPAVAEETAGDRIVPESEIISIAKQPGDSASPGSVDVPRRGRAGLITAPAKPAPDSGSEPSGPDEQGEAKAADGPGTADAESDQPNQLVPYRRSKVLTALFVVSLLVLVVAVPVLATVGSRALLRSTGGDFEKLVNDSRAPGFTAIVEPTPTALVIQRDSQDDPVALTLLSLGNGDDGGSVLFIPLDTNLISPAFFIDRLRTAYSNAKNPKGNDAQLIAQTAILLNIGFTDVIDLTNDDWAQLAAPIGPISIDNPSTVTFGDPANGGFEFPAGPLQLSAAQVGPYLAATSLSQDDLDRLARHKLFWQAWLKAIADSPSPDAVPNTLTGIGPYATSLAQGQTGIDTLAVVSAAQLVEGYPTFQVDSARMRTQIAEAVPAPLSPGLGARYTVRLLNGVDGEPIPDGLFATLVAGGAQINAKGNATSFGRQVTRIEYHDENRKGTAIFVQRALGAGKVVANLSANDTVDLVITIGDDVLNR